MSPRTRIGIALAAALLVPSLAGARECTCDDLAALRTRAAAAAKAEQAWAQIFAWARGLRQSPPQPTTNEELNARFGELMNAAPNGWDGIMSQPVTQTGAPSKIAGLDANGEPVIDKNFAGENCDTIVQAVLLHENTHKQFFLSPGNVLAAGISDNLLRLRAESEVVSYRAEKEFLQEKADELEKKCKRTATCTTSNGITYTAKRCGASPWGEWTLTVSGPMSGHGKVTVSEKGGGSWSAEATVAGVPVTITQTGRAEYIPQPQAILRLTTNVGSADGHTETPNKSIDLAVSFTDQCP
jgi:hypothetical protein